MAWNEWLDVKRILLGIGSGMMLGFIGGMLITGILGIPLGDLTQSAIIYLPAGFFAAWRGKGSALGNSTLAGLGVFTISVMLAGFTDLITWDAVHLIGQMVVAVGMSLGGGLLTIFVK